MSPPRAHTVLSGYCNMYKVINLLFMSHCPGNVFSLGDCSNVPTAKTAAAVAAESHVLKHNLLEVMKGNTPSSKVCRPPSTSSFLSSHSPPPPSCRASISAFWVHISPEGAHFSSKMTASSELSCVVLHCLQIYSIANSININTFIYSMMATLHVPSRPLLEKPF